MKTVRLMVDVEYEPEKLTPEQVANVTMALLNKFLDLHRPGEPPVRQEAGIGAIECKGIVLK